MNICEAKIFKSHKIKFHDFNNYQKHVRPHDGELRPLILPLGQLQLRNWDKMLGIFLCGLNLGWFFPHLWVIPTLNVILWFSHLWLRDVLKMGEQARWPRRGSQHPSLRIQTCYSREQRAGEAVEWCGSNCSLVSTCAKEGMLRGQSWRHLLGAGCWQTLLSSWLTSSGALGSLFLPLLLSGGGWTFLQQLGGRISGSVPP